MNIAIDARWIFPEISGIGAYTRELIRALARHDTDHTYLLLFNLKETADRTLAETGLADADHVTTRIVPFGVFSPRSQLALPGILASARVDLYHSTNYMIPLRAFPRHRRGRMACVTTIHDVIPMIFPRHAPRSRKARLYPLYRWVMKQIGQRSDAIIADSRASRSDVITHLRIRPRDEARVTAVYCGVSSRFQPGHAPDSDPSRPRTVLYVGRMDPYKNVPTLIRAFHALRDLCPFPVRLVIAGSRDARYPEAPALCHELGLDDHVTWTGYVSDDELIRLYQTADVLAHPSRYEGFGLQVAEAMACGTPVVCSGAGSLAEVAGDATILADPDDTDGFTDGLKQILTDPTLADAYRRKGIRQAANFTWERTARETLAIYNQTLTA
jgi:glycosyltransferase involved in cell wall biosynthesis